MEAKYYTPTIEEFHIGFEYEINDYALEAIPGVKPDKNLWHQKVFTNDYMSLVPGLDYTGIFRVKCLDAEDIESLGWENLGSGWYNLKEVSGELGYFLHVRLRIWGDNSFIKAYRYDPKNRPKELENDEDFLFQGNIKNKSELNKIMHQTKIKS